MIDDRTSNSSARHVLATGATGYVGARVLRRLEVAGIGWTALSRTAPASTKGRHVPFRFGQPLDASAVGLVFISRPRDVQSVPRQPLQAGARLRARFTGL